MAKINDFWFKALQGISYLLLYLLSLEFILPLKKISDTSRIDGFIIFIAIVMMFLFFFKKRVILFVSGLTSIHVILLYLYFDQTKESIKNFILNLYLKFYGDQKLILAMDWNSISNELKTLLFLLVLWLVARIFVYLLDKKKSLLIVIILSLYLAYIDSVLWYDSKWAIVRVVAVGLLFISFEKQRQFITEMNEIKTLSFRFLMTAQVLILIIVSMGYVLPKADAKWESPVKIFEDYQGKGINSVGTKYNFTGYGDDDSLLGGPSKQDETIVILTSSDRLSYWRGESKDTYTGKGWINSKEEVESQISNIVLNIEGIDAQIDHYLLYDNVGLEEKIIKQTLLFPEERFNHLFYSGEVRNILEIAGTQDQYQINNIFLNSHSGKAEVSFSLKDYTIESRVPIINISLLRNSPMVYTDMETEYLAPFLALPNSLPNRVTDLAKEVTSNYTNPYDKANAIRAYLQGNYTYELENVIMPKDNQDFVDQFLFESGVGYCNHFSTSMVVLARSVGIPARWVKGFAPGEVNYNSETKSFEGVVRNSDAHSWVEVYFSGIGWVPFEPTPSFRYPTEYRTNASNEASEDNEEVLPVLNDTDKTDNDLTNPTVNNSGNIFRDYLRYLLWFIEALFLILIVLAILNRHYLLVLLLKLRMGQEGPIRQLILRVTDKMVKRLEKKYKEKESHYTLREYMSSIFGKHQDEIWVDALRIYEEARYNNQEIQESWRIKIWDIWKRIISR